MERVLTNTHRKQLHDILVAAGVDPTITRWTDASKSWATPPVETLEVGLCHFLFAADSDGFMTTHVKPAPTGAAQEGFVSQSWKEVIELFRRWAQAVSEEINQVDPWAKYAIYLPQTQGVGSHGNSPFTHGEAEHAAKAVTSFLSHVKDSVAGYEAVEADFDPQFERLAQQAKTGAGRIDWSNQFTGMLISLCMTLSLAPETASSLWKSWVQIIDGLLLK